MWSNPCTAQDVMERRHEFVSEGAQSARWLAQIVAERFGASRKRLLLAASDALLSVGRWLKQKGTLSPTHS